MGICTPVLKFPCMGGVKSATGVNEIGSRETSTGIRGVKAFTGSLH